MLFTPQRVTAIALSLVALAYLPSVKGGFLVDDNFYVAENEKLQSLPLGESWRLLVERFNPYEFLPVRDLSYRLDLEFFGLSPAGYHVHNIVLYLMCCVAVWLFLRTIADLFESELGLGGDEGQARKAWISTVATVLFAAHPAHVESVAWISGRKDLLSGVFGMLSLWQFAASLRSNRPSWRNLGLSYGFFVLAVMSKSAVLSVVPVAFLLAGAIVGRREISVKQAARSIVLTVGPMALIGAGWLGVTLAVGKRTMILAGPTVDGAAIPGGLLWYPAVILGYLVKITVMPLNLRLVYDVAQPGVVTLVAAAVGIMAIVGAAIGTVVFFRKGSLIGFGAAFFVLFCAPYIQLVPFNTWSLASERFVFIAVLGPILAFASPKLPAGRGLQIAVVALLFPIGVALTGHQARKWGSTDRLVADTARLAPGSTQAQLFWMREVLLPAGRYLEAEEAASGLRNHLAREIAIRHVRSLRELASGNTERAVREAEGLEYLIDSTTPPFLLLLAGELQERQGNDFEAIGMYYRAANSSRLSGDARNAQSALAGVRSRHQDRLDAMRRAVKENPDDWVLQGNLANLEIELYLFDDAIPRLERILQSQPDHPLVHYNLGLAFMRQELYEKSAFHLEKAISNGYRTAIAWNNLGTVRQKNDQPEGAAQAFERALALDPNHCHAAINLGKLHLRSNEPDRAEAAFQMAREVACGPEYDSLIDVFMGMAGSETRRDR
jgi:tetratricopeptide (TPR) repeat protein